MDATLLYQRVCVVRAAVEAAVKACEDAADRVKSLVEYANEPDIERGTYQYKVWAEAAWCENHVKNAASSTVSCRNVLADIAPPPFNTDLPGDPEPNECDGPDGPCPGWLHMNEGDPDDPTTGDVQRCDTCKKYDDDWEAACAHGRECGCGMPMRGPLPDHVTCDECSKPLGEYVVFHAGRLLHEECHKPPSPTCGENGQEV